MRPGPASLSNSLGFMGEEPQTPDSDVTYVPTDYLLDYVTPIDLVPRNDGDSDGSFTTAWSLHSEPPEKPVREHETEAPH